MRKIMILLCVVTMAVGCSSWRKKSGADAGVISETTGTGGSEKVDASAMNYGATGSDSGSIEGLQSISFEYDSVALPASEKAKLDGNVAWLKKNNGKMQIEGHCDQRGSTEYNLSLGERRAIAVKKMMTSMGIAADRLTTVSFGKEKLLSTGESEADMAKNRRANFVPSGN
ncbi:MAG: hypothetical protein A2622_03115 [Bdellovibrionales bacterium RIFCSPHIGHO2_01_FULL_40_29]|nr:MAG: hypothetical protein A2622_03115 [Bdellovibrionales bacterium RIFCSPHIGHO2_01_FULL_40_29]OFZ34063.1 MAG: hypothetical protein A3D17_03535 [Bdellovibrionales bacterium RIFCSPHIGHO2_02_FULL_40_15]